MVLHKEDLASWKPLLAEWVTNKVGDDWITDLPKSKALKYTQMIRRLIG